jgi:hypothetical protein
LGRGLLFEPARLCLTRFADFALSLVTELLCVGMQLGVYDELRLRRSFVVSFVAPHGGWSFFDCKVSTLSSGPLSLVKEYQASPAFSTLHEAIASPERACPSLLARSLHTGNLTYPTPNGFHAYDIVHGFNSKIRYGQWLARKVLIKRRSQRAVHLRVMMCVSGVPRNSRPGQSRQIVFVSMSCIFGKYILASTVPC